MEDPNLKFSEYEIVKIIKHPSRRMIGRECVIAGVWAPHPRRRGIAYHVCFLDIEEHHEKYARENEIFNAEVQMFYDYSERFTENQLESTGRFMNAKEFSKTFYKFKFFAYEIVRIIKNRSKKLIGRQGIISNIWPPYSIKKGFFYNLNFMEKDDYSKMLREDQIESTGQFMTPKEYFKEFYGDPPTIIKVRVDPETGMGWIVDQDEEEANKKI